MSKSGKGFALGLLAGAAIGSAVALLYAPDSGSNLRGKLSYRVSAYTDELNRLIRQLKAEKEKFTDRKSTRLNSSHVAISYAVFCLKKKKAARSSIALI